MNLARELEKPQKCEKCDKKFNNKREIKDHILTVHERKQLYGCSFCNIRFPDLNIMKAHLVSVH